MRSRSPDAKWFDERPHRTERCSRCGGCGTMDVAYALVPADAKVVGAPKGAICAFVVGSFDIFTACEEAADIARKSGSPVAFEFNGSCVVVRPKDDPGAIARRWYVKTYGETPEQAWERR
jgi:hypothetical protein